MKRIVMLVLVLGLLLSACGRAEAETVPETSEEQSITEAPTTEAETTTEAPFVHTSGESNGVKWRTLDLEDEANAEVKESFLWWYMLHHKEGEYQLGDKKIILEQSPYQLVMVENNGKKTVLLPKTYHGSETDMEKVSPDDYSWHAATFIAALDDRYFLFCWGSYGDLCGYSIYDTKELREIPLDIAQERWGAPGFYDKMLYFTDEGWYGSYDGTKHLWAYDWTAIVRGEPIEAVDFLAAFSGPGATQISECLVTSDAKYFLVPEEEGLRIYDLIAKKMTTLPRSEFSSSEFYPQILHEWNGKVYWNEFNFSSEIGYALEITLP